MLQQVRPKQVLSPLLAAIVYDDGPAFDAFAYHLAKDLRAKGLRLAGVAQTNHQRQQPGRCDMTLEDLATGTKLLISEDRGSQARGCRLNTSALLEAGVLICRQLSEDIDLVLINKFGKSEAEGGGLRDVIATAFVSGIPALIGVPQRNWTAWQTFSGGDAACLSPHQSDIAQWLQGLPFKSADF